MIDIPKDLQDPRALAEACEALENDDDVILAKLYNDVEQIYVRRYAALSTLKTMGAKLRAQGVSHEDLMLMYPTADE